MTIPPDDFNHMLLRHIRPLHQRALKLSSSITLAEDLVQETIARALHHAARFVPGTNMRAWLVAIMSNLHIDGCRHRSHEVLSKSGSPPEVAAPEPEQPPAWEDFSLGEVQALIPLLTPELRKPMWTFVAGTRSYRELSAKLGIPTSTVGTRLWRARQQLRQLLESKRAGRLSIGAADELTHQRPARSGRPVLAAP
jgi:RNA polymerase sigma-70 factor (ECF subfamily)